jgi:phosphatidylserine decarboxylase
LTGVMDKERATGLLRVRNRLGKVFGIAAEGVPIGGAVLALGFAVSLLGFAWPGTLIIVAAFAVAAFFRDPERAPKNHEGAVISGADGKVTDIGEGCLPGGSHEERYRRVSVFMSPFDVHVNRAPITGEVISVEHTAGKFRPAFRDEASEHNERNLIVLSDAAGRRHAMVQVAGYLARRIVCRLRPADMIERGERVGMIMFGSRVDHFMPLDYRIAVEIGDRVRAGESIIGERQR